LFVQKEARLTGLALKTYMTLELLKVLANVCSTGCCLLFSRMKRHVLQFAPRDARDVRRRVPVARSSGESPIRAVIVARAR
jgi:hypothetical protein